MKLTHPRRVIVLLAAAFAALGAGGAAAAHSSTSTSTQQGTVTVTGTHAHPALSRHLPAQAPSIPAAGPVATQPAHDPDAKASAEPRATHESATAADRDHEDYVPHGPAFAFQPKHR